jgi:sugar (pentulose or hexulose) kinase
LIGLDIGTSAIKGVLMSSDGEIVSSARKPTEYLFSEEGHVQFDVDRLYALTVGVIRELAHALPEGHTVAGLSMASASGNTVLLDDRGVPGPAISWMDQRVTHEIETVFGSLQAEEIHDRMGWPLLNQFPLAHLSWLKCHRPGMLESATRVCMSTDYLNFRLTGNWGIDYSTATTFYLLDQKAGQWHLPYLQQLGIARGKLPQLQPSGTILGKLTTAAASATGLPPGTPVVLGAFDHACAARGSGVLDEGQFLLSTGTSWVGFFPVKDRQKAVRQQMLVDPFLSPDGAWGAMFSLPAIANHVEKYIYQFVSTAPDPYHAFDRLAGLAPPGANGLLIHPMREPDAALADHDSRADISRAIMEGTAYLLKAQIDKFDRAGLKITSVTMAGGPSESLTWPQVIADMLNLEVSTMSGAHAGARGAAILAGIGVGLYRDEREVRRRLGAPKATYTPNQAAHKVYQAGYRKFTEHATMKPYRGDES